MTEQTRRFRPLTKDELEGLELEFARFLATQGIGADEWGRIGKEDPDGMEELIWKFSTMFWEITTSRLTYLERHDSGDAWYFKFGENSAQLMRIDPEGTRFQGEKSYAEEARGQEVFLILEQGGTPVPNEEQEKIDTLFNAATT